MTTYRAIASTETDPEAPVTSALMKALDLNVAASMEGDSLAPVNSYAWHPYNKVTVNDANTGRIWSLAVDGAQATITSPDFVDGYDYAFLFDRVATNSGTGGQTQINFYRETSAAYAGVTSLQAGNISNIINTTFMVELENVRLTRDAHYAAGRGSTGTLANAITGFASIQASVRHATAQKILRVQFSPATGGASFAGTGAAIYMLRKRNILV